jgi:hypothetical protein
VTQAATKPIPREIAIGQIYLDRWNHSHVGLKRWVQITTLFHRDGRIHLAYVRAIWSETEPAAEAFGSGHRVRVSRQSLRSAKFELVREERAAVNHRTEEIPS